MQLRRNIALWLCTLCLVAMGTPAVLSLCCPCNTYHRHTEACNHVTVEADDEECTAWVDPCCSDRHTIAITPYLFSHSELDRRQLNPAIQHLFSALCGSSLAALAVAESEQRIVRKEHTPPLLRPLLWVRTLRAPPVWC